MTDVERAWLRGVGIYRTSKMKGQGKLADTWNRVFGGRRRNV